MAEQDNEIYNKGFKNGVVTAKINAVNNMISNEIPPTKACRMAGLSTEEYARYSEITQKNMQDGLL